MRALAARLGARFALLDVQAPEALLRERIAQRDAEGNDASEATSDVLDHQLRHQAPLTEDESPDSVAIDTSECIDFDALAARLRALPWKRRKNENNGPL
jgi:predicted kinase